MKHNTIRPLAKRADPSFHQSYIEKLIASYTITYIQRLLMLIHHKRSIGKLMMDVKSWIMHLQPGVQKTTGI